MLFFSFCSPHMCLSPTTLSLSAMLPSVCVYMSVCLSQGFPDDLVICGRGVIKDQGQRPFPFPWEDEWPCLKVAAYGLGAIRVGVSQQPSLLCVQKQVLEKGRNTQAHNPFCWNQHTAARVDKLNTFSFLFTPRPSCFPSCSTSHAHLFSFPHKPGKTQTNVLTPGGR